MTINNLIKSLRISRRLKQRELAELSGVPVTVLSKIENNQRDPNKNHLIAISEALKVPNEMLLLLTIDRSKIENEKLPFLDAILDIVNSHFISDTLEELV